MEPEGNSGEGPISNSEPKALVELIEMDVDLLKRVAELEKERAEMRDQLRNWVDIYNRICDERDELRQRLIELTKDSE